MTGPDLPPEQREELVGGGNYEGPRRPEAFVSEPRRMFSPTDVARMLEVTEVVAVDAPALAKTIATDVAERIATARAKGDRQGAARVTAAVEALAAEWIGRTQDGRGVISDHWRGPDFADGADMAYETAAEEVRAVLAQTSGNQPGRNADSGLHRGPSAPAQPLPRVPGPPEGSQGRTEPQEES